MFFFTGAIILWNAKKLFNSRIIFLLLNIFATVVFWAVVYEWNDRRFLLYLIPFIYPLFGYMLDLFIDTVRMKHLLLMVLLLYPTTLSIGDFFNFYTIPVSPTSQLTFAVTIDLKQQGVISFPLTLQKGIFNYKDMVPTFGELIARSDYLRGSVNTRYSQYVSVFENSLKLEEGRLCIDPAGYSLYELNGVLLIEQNVTIDEIYIAPCINKGSN
jgi:vacuolar-type H+-ATPase subunit I/STV1